MTASLGAVWIKGHYDYRAQARQAEQSRSGAREDQQRQAYSDLVATARLVLRSFRQLLLHYLAGAPEDPAQLKEAYNQTTSLAADMDKAAGLAELVGSPAGRKHARAIHEKAKACSDLFPSPETILAALDANPFLFSPPKAETACDELATAIDQFIEAANTELAQ